MKRIAPAPIVSLGLGERATLKTRSSGGNKFTWRGRRGGRPWQTSWLQGWWT